MSNLAIYNPKTQELSEVSFIKDTLNQTLISEVKDSVQIINEISRWIGETALMMKVNGAVPQHHKIDIKEMVLMRFKNFSFDELYYAFKMERFGVLGEKTTHYQSFDAEYVGKILDKYLEWKREVKRIRNISNTEKRVETTTEERSVIREEFLQNIYADLKERGYCEDAWLLFDELEKNGKLLIGNSRKKEIYQEQKVKYLNQLKLKVLDRDIKTKIKRIISSEEQGQTNAEIKRRSKSFSVSDHLSDYMEDFESFKNHINKKPGQ